MINLHVRVFTASLAVVFLVACSSNDGPLRNRSEDYLRSDSVAVIEVPEGMDSSRIGEIYPIPQGGEAASYEIDEDFDVPRPNSMTSNAAANDVRIQNLSGDYWILAALPPSETWPRVRNYLTEAGIPTYQTEASLGVIETSMMQFNDDDFNTHQFRLILSQGVQRGTTEVKVVQRAFPKDNVPTSLPNWSNSSESSTREQWLREELAAALANDLSTGAASMLGQEIGAREKVEMHTPETEDPYIRLILSYERAWGSVGYALDREGFQIDDQDRTSGIYYTSYAPPVLEEDEPGFVMRLFGADQERPRTDYQVQLRPAEDGIEVRIFRSDFSTLSQRDAFNLLTIIRNNLT